MVDDLTISLKLDITPTQLGYFPPSWSSMPKKKYSIDVWKEGTIVKNISLNDKEYYVLGRNNVVCDITLAHPTVSRVHCVLQHRDNGYLYIYDLKTAYGTFVSQNKIEAQIYIKLSPGETFKIADSTKMFILNCEEENERDEEAIQRNASSSGIHIADTLQLLMQPNIGSIQFNNESHWGIEDNEEEIIQYQLNEDNIDDNDININELLQKDNLTAKQRSLVEKITQLLSERDHIIKERENLKYAYDDDNDTQKKQIERKKYYFTKRLSEIKESLDSFKLKLSDSLKTAEENSLRFNKKLLKESNDNDDEYYDRTKSIKAKEKNTTEVINYESMKSTLECLIKEKQKYTDLLSQTEIKSKRKEREVEIDSIDRYFIDNKLETKTENIKDKLESIENEITKTEKLLDYVTPLHLKIKKNAEANNSKKILKMNYVPHNPNAMNNKHNSNKPPNKKKESIAEVMNKMNKIQNSTHHLPMNNNNTEGNEGLVNDINSLEDNYNEVQLDEEMIDKLNEYKNMLSQNEDKDKRKKEQDKPYSNKHKEINLFKEIVDNIGKSNFEVSNYPHITSRYDSLKESKVKKDSQPTEYLNPNEEESLFKLQGKKRQRDEMKPENFITKDEIDEDDKGKWTEETIPDNPFNKYLNHNDN